MQHYDFFSSSFLPAEEGIHFWRSSWGRLSPMTGQRRSFNTGGGGFSTCCYCLQGNHAPCDPCDTVNISPNLTSQQPSCLSLSVPLQYQRDPRRVSLHLCVLHQPQPLRCFTYTWRSKNTRRFCCCFVFLSKCWSFKSPQIEDLHSKKKVCLKKYSLLFYYFLVVGCF